MCFKKFHAEKLNVQQMATVNGGSSSAPPDTTDASVTIIMDG
ncbi:hypothetical protein [Leptobacterium sp. I13]